MKKYILLITIFCFFYAVNYAQSGIKKVDFNNFTYEPLCGGDIDGEPYGKITVKNGKIENIKEVDGVNEVIDDNLPNYFSVGNFLYGDLNGDGKEEAVVSSDCNTGGTGQFSEGYIFTIKNGKPVLLTRIEGGDRGFGGLVDIKIVKGLLVVEQNDPEGGANCCAVYTLMTKYKLNGNKLVPIGKPIRRKIKFLEQPKVPVEYKTNKSEPKASQIIDKIESIYRRLNAKNCKTTDVIKPMRKQNEKARELADASAAKPCLEKE
ncbi:MAG: hypothetical protein ACR2J3_06780 [Aridibacter sp.]